MATIYNDKPVFLIGNDIKVVTIFFGDKGIDITVEALRQLLDGHVAANMMPIYGRKSDG